MELKTLLAIHTVLNHTIEFVMGCPSIIAEWQVKHWTRISHQRNSPGATYKQNDSSYANPEQNIGATASQSVTRRKFRDEHAEDLNPLTRNWRESLRVWSYRFMALPPLPEPVKKKTIKFKK